MHFDQVEAQLDYGPGSEIRVGWKIGVTWSRKWGFKMAATKLGYLLTKSSFWLSLWYDLSISWHGGKELYVWYVLPTIAIHPWPQVMPIFDREMPPDSHLPFVYVVILSISPIWGLGETNPSSKTSKILFSTVMQTFGRSCRRPRLHGLKNQSQVSWTLKQIFQDGGHRICTRTLGRKHTRKSASFWWRRHVQYFFSKFAKYLMLEACWLWFQTCQLLKIVWCSTFRGDARWRAPGTRSGDICIAAQFFSCYLESGYQKRWFFYVLYQILEGTVV